MSGTTAITGFLFAFMILIGITISLFTVFQTQIEDQQLIFERASEDSFISKLKSDFEIIGVFNNSGRLSFLINNTENSKLYFNLENKECFSIIEDETFLDDTKYKITTEGGAAYSYDFAEPNSFILLTLQTDTDFSGNKTYKITSCGGITKTYVLSSSSIDYWDLAWNEKDTISITNPSSNSIVEYQVPIVLNSSNFDFSLADENDIRFIFPIRESRILDLNFDIYSNTLTDNSKFSNEAYLGTSSGVESSDPSELVEAVFISGLNFDGDDDFVFLNRTSNEAISDKELTISFWIKRNLGGDSNQFLYFDNETKDSIYIVNDGSGDDNKVRFELNVSNTLLNITSNHTISDETWHHLVLTYDGAYSRIYVDSELSSQSNYLEGDLLFDLDNSYIGSKINESNFNGSIDEYKIFNIELFSSEISELFYQNLWFRELDFYVSDWQELLDDAVIYVKIPYIPPNSEIEVQMYYDNYGTESTSNIESTFSYKVPRSIGYVVSERTESNGLQFMSLYDDNTIRADSFEYNLSELEIDTLSSGNTNIDTEISAKKLVQVEGDGNGGDIIVPSSWAGTEFYYRGHRNDDYICMLAPWGDADITISYAGTNVFETTVDENGFCHNNDTPTTSQYAIVSDVPILVAGYGDVSDDQFSYYPSTSRDLYGIPSSNTYIGAGPNGAEVIGYSSDGSVNTYSIGSDSTATQSGSSQGAGPYYRFTSDNPISIIQQGDGDGADSTVYAPRTEMGLLFGSGTDTDYISLASPYSDANCALYEGTTNLFNITTGTGSNLIYNYTFPDTNPDLAGGPWKVECEKPVWGYFERDNGGDESNMLGHLQMRQYQFPPPTYTIIN